MKSVNPCTVALRGEPTMRLKSRSARLRFTLTGLCLLVTAVPCVAEEGQAVNDEKERIMSGTDRLILETVVDQDQVEKDVLYYLLRKLRGLSYEEIDSNADLSITMEHYATVPEKCRGRVVQVRGRLMRLAVTKLPDLSLGMDHIYEGQIVDRELDMYSFYILEEPVGIQVMDDEVVLNGYFLKQLVYQNRKVLPDGTRGLTATPLIVGRRLLRIARPAPRTGSVLNEIVASLYKRNPPVFILLVVSIVVFGVLVRMQVQRKAKEREARRYGFGRRRLSS